MKNFTAISGQAAQLSLKAQGSIGAGEGRNGSNQRKMGLITTQLLNVADNIKPSKSVVSKEQSTRESKLSLYAENTTPFDARTEDGRKTAGHVSNVLTDPKINLFSTQPAANQKS